MFKLLMFILLLPICTYSQVLMAESKDLKFYVFTDSVVRSGNALVFNTAVIEKKVKSAQVMTANCGSYTYMIIAEQVLYKGQVYYFTYKNPKLYTAYKDSAMHLVLKELCNADPAGTSSEEYTN